jgi:predicted GNAT family acetyltransferase
VAKEFSNQKDANRYAMHIDGELVGVLDYRIGDGVIALSRAFTNPLHRGKGYAAELVDYAVKDIETTELAVLPSCWYVGEWFDKHPERRGVLQSG